jgi:hypothetical protein
MTLNQRLEMGDAGWYSVKGALKDKIDALGAQLLVKLALTEQ